MGSNRKERICMTASQWAGQRDRSRGGGEGARQVDPTGQNSQSSN
jgi:hypothetical protein